MGDVRSRPSSIALAVAVLAAPVLAGCTAGPAPGPAHSAASSLAPAAAAPPRPSGPAGSPGHPLLVGCGQESFTVPPVPDRPQPGDLVIGSLDIGSVLRLATANPADYGDRGSYKVPFILTPGSTATVTIAARARGQVMIRSPSAPAGRVTAATYHSCSGHAGFFAQGFTFTGGQVRGCVPLDVTIGPGTRVRHVTLSLFAGRCAS
jgi:hypothetical protein